VDVFHLGVQLFIMAFGNVPFKLAENERDMLSNRYYRYIASNDFEGFVQNHPALKNRVLIPEDEEVIRLAMSLMAS